MAGEHSEALKSVQKTKPFDVPIAFDEGLPRSRERESKRLQMNTIHLHQFELIACIASSMVDFWLLQLDRVGKYSTHTNVEYVVDTMLRNRGVLWC